MIKIAIIGFGVVGSGVYEVIRTNRLGISRKAAKKVDIKYILDIRDFSNHPESALFTKDFSDILNDPEIEVVVETAGGATYAYDYTKRALLAGKSVVTSNKELVAAHGAELLAIAQEKDVNYLFEASVGGGIPIVRPLSQCLAANDISDISGILNGTTNYILTKMVKEGASFGEALAEAQRLGYAERDATADIEGHDTCRKIAILTSLVFGAKIDSEKIPTEGISSLTKEDMGYAEALGCSIKLLGVSHVEDGRVSARVCPMMVPSGNPLYNVEDVFNGILVVGNAIGDVMFYGRGAGKLPTASAVVADVIDAAKNPRNNGRFFWEPEREGALTDPNGHKNVFFVRIAPTAKDAAAREFGTPAFIPGKNEYGFKTPKMTEAEFNRRIKGIDGVISKIRVFENGGA